MGSATTTSRVLLEPPTNTAPRGEGWKSPGKSPSRLPPIGHTTGATGASLKPLGVPVTDAASPRRLPTLNHNAVEPVHGARPLPMITTEADGPKRALPVHNQISPENTLDEGDENSDEVRRRKHKKKKKKSKRRDEEEDGGRDEQ